MELMYEIKAEVADGSEHAVARKIGLTFIKEYSDVDYYLSGGGMNSLKLKRINDGNNIVYELFFDGDCFNISSRNVGDSEAERLLHDDPPAATLERTKRVYYSKKFDVNMEFDYIKQLPKRLFIEIISVNKQRTMSATDYLEKNFPIKEFIDVPYDKLLLGSRPGRVDV